MTTATMALCGCRSGCFHRRYPRLEHHRECKLEQPEVSVTVATTIDPLRLRRVMGKEAYRVPIPFGPAGWQMTRWHVQGSVIATAFAMEDGSEWLHASISYDERLPAYSELVKLHHAVFGDGYAYQVFAPAVRHVNIHANALHLWGRADGKPVLPEFAMGGSI